MSSFKEFITNNGIIATTAGITIGFATASFIKSFVADVVLPIVFLLLVKGTGKVSSGTSSFFSKFLSNKEFMFTNFVSELITWVLIVITAWIILELVFKYMNAQSGIKFSNPFGGVMTKQEHKEHYSSGGVMYNTKQEHEPEHYYNKQAQMPHF